MIKLFGHGHIWKILADGVSSHRLGHAYLFEGAEGIGKMTTVHRLARLLMCKNGGECGICDDCTKLEAGSHPDVVIADETYFQAEKIKPESVEAMRKIRQDAYGKPFMGAWKMYVIPHADNMLVSAQNSLLKILEEPPSYCVFILLCENAGKILETIRSRSILMRFQPLDDEEMMAFLRAHYDEKKAAALLRPSGGIPGFALQIAEDESFLKRRETASQLFCNFFQNHDLLPVSSFLEQEKDVWEHVLGHWIDMTAEAAEYAVCHKQHVSDSSERLAEMLDVSTLLNVFDRLQETIVKLRGNANFSLAVTDLLMNCLAAGKEKKDG